MNLTTGKVTILGQNDDGLGDTTPQDPAWSSDGTIALVPSFQSPLVLYRLVSRAGVPGLRMLRQIEYPSGGAWPGDPDFSPDGRSLALSTTTGTLREVWIADVRTGKLVRRITSRGWSPSWSPDGQRLAFVSKRHGDIEIYTVNADGTDVRRVTFSRGPDTEPAWRPRVR